MAEKIKKPEVNEIATAQKDIDIFSGWINRLENPDPVLRTEAQGKGLKLYDDVDRDAHAGSVLQTRYLSVVGKEWNIEPAQTGISRGRPRAETQEQKIADFVKEVFLECNFDQARQELLQGILYGFYVGEVMWKYANDQVRIAKIRAKHPRRFSFTTDRELRLLTPQNMIEGEEVPDRKFIVFNYGSSDNPYGKGLGQKLWWPVWFKKHGIKFWMIFCEKFGAPTPVGKYPAGTKKEDQDLLLEAIDALQQETGVIIPEGMTIDLLEAQRSGTINTYESLCGYMDKQMSKTVLGQTATTEGTPGKLGNEESQEEVRDDITKADADLLCECINNTLIPWLVDFNFPGVTAYPKIWIRTEEEKDLKPLADRDVILVRDIGLRVGEQYFYDTYSIPKPEEGEKLVSPQSSAPKLFSEYAEQDISESLDGEMEKKRQELINGYFNRLSAITGEHRDAALNEMQKMMLASPVMTEAAFTAAVYKTLSKYYQKLNQADISDAVKGIYDFYRLSDKSTWLGNEPPITFAFTPIDQGVLDSLQNLDKWHLSKFIENQDMQGPAMNWLKNQYLEKGEGLFGRGSREAIDGFRSQFADQLTGLEDWQIRRIIDTSVTRMRSVADIMQADQAGVGKLRIVAAMTERTCERCAALNGTEIDVAGVHSNMLNQIKQNPASGAYLQMPLPPFHPNCHCRTVMVV
ncbi:MAG: DUF935 family protein [Thermodesulfobacteriota bacterium]|nr:MAG: DUF935 family protein [Thermodesulfobacteriota bacterium]